MRYMNPGFKNWFPNIGASSSLTEITDTIKSKTGVAFNNTDYRNYILFSYPASGEIWCKFDFYCPTNPNGIFYFGEYINGSEPYNGFAFSLGRTSFTCYIFVKGQYKKIFENVPAIDFGFKYEKINSALFHLKWADSEVGVLNLTVNDFVFDSIENSDLTPYDKTNFKFTFRDTGSLLVSNIILSDEKISIKEQIVALPISGVETDMTFDSETGIYTASAANQSLLADVDVADLINNFGGDSKVTGISVVGNPAYRTAEGLSSFTAITKNFDSVAEHSSTNLTNDTDSVVQSGFSVSDTTIADLQNIQLGLKVGG